MFLDIIFPLIPNMFHCFFPKFSVLLQKFKKKSKMTFLIQTFLGEKVAIIKKICSIVVCLFQVFQEALVEIA